MSVVRLAVALLLVGIAAGCGGRAPSVKTPEAAATMTVTSSAFGDGGDIPRRHTCDGENLSPPLAFGGVPSGTGELALLVEDPDAPGGTFVHWTAWGIPTTASQIPPNVPTDNLQQGKNSFGKTGYGAPCPPKGDAPHRYVFTLYALSNTLPLGEGASPSDVSSAIADIAIAKGVLTGKYGR